MKLDLNYDEITVILDCLQLISQKDQNKTEEINNISLNQVYNKLYTARENGFYIRTAEVNL
jgi:hypothetical protein